MARRGSMAVVAVESGRAWSVESELARRAALTGMAIITELQHWLERI